MISFKNFNSEHSDVIHDAQYDHCGLRLATCSADQLIKIWEKNDNQEWSCTANLQGHVGAVWRIVWAHPEFGTVIASCGFDRTIIIWEEMYNCQDKYNTANWEKRAQLFDFRSSITDLKFAPNHLGFVLASCSTDGMIRLYEAQDIMDTTNWTLQYDFQTYITASCISMSTRSTGNTILAIGNSKPNDGNISSLLLYEYNSQKTWEHIEAFKNITKPVNDIAFAHDLGQSYDTLAVAADQLYVFYIKKMDATCEIGAGDRPSRYIIEMATGLNGILSKVWRVSWNAIGTTLASSGEDGIIRLWSRNHLLYWQQIGSIQSECPFPFPRKRVSEFTDNCNSISNQIMETDHVSNSNLTEFVWQDK